MTKNLKTNIAIALFLLAAIADIYAIITANETIETYAKPMLLTLLAVVYLAAATKPNFWYVLGMFFCF